MEIKPPAPLTDVRNTPLYEEHLRLKALLAPFAGWNMPIHYGSILEEAKYTRKAVSIFDISHMGEFIVKEDPAAASLDRAVTIPVTKIKKGRCRYGFLLNEEGKILDDLIAYRIDDGTWMLVVNACNEERDFATLAQRLAPGAGLENISARTAKIDVQGPLSLEVVTGIAGDGVEKLTYFSFQAFPLLGGSSIISRTGYTGELGFEIYIDSAKATELWRELLNHGAVRPAGLGARDILRLEMGLPLYGSELTGDTTPLEAGLERFLDMDKDFTGRQALVEQDRRGISRRLSGFIVDGRRTPRHGNRIIAGNRDAGFVTSGVFSPHLNSGIGMGYIDAELSGLGGDIAIAAGREEIRAKIAKLPFLRYTSLHGAEV